MRSLAATLMVSWCLGCGSTAALRDSSLPADVAPCDEAEPCGGTATSLDLGIVIAALLGVSLVMRVVAK